MHGIAMNGDLAHGLEHDLDHAVALKFLDRFCPRCADVIILPCRWSVCFACGRFKGPL